MPNPIDDIRKTVAQAAEAVRDYVGGPFPSTALILGSGLGDFGGRLTVDAAISYADIPGFPVSTVAGHAGRLLVGRAGRTPVACMQGRMHLYEGYPPQALAVPIRTLRRLGADTLILTNAAGGIRRDLTPGRLMIVDDHINFSGANPLTGPNDDATGPRFVDMSAAYDADLRAGLHRAAHETGITVTSGVYVQVAGPSFETPAEIRMLAAMGADAVGMSTVPECIVARHCGMRVAALSLITNAAAGLAEGVLSHDETMREAAKAGENVSRLLLRFLQDLTGGKAELHWGAST